MLKKVSHPRPLKPRIYDDQADADDTIEQPRTQGGVASSLYIFAASCGLSEEMGKFDAHGTGMGIDVPSRVSEDVQLTKIAR
jgi:hypothetical protein